MILLLLFTGPLWGAIKDPIQHTRNQEIMRRVIDSTDPESISRSLVTIGQRAIGSGFDLSAYDIDQWGEALVFSMESVWEGKGLPLTLFVYIWPGEEEALARAPNKDYYRSNIHSHPIPCAVTVLRGSIDQITYRPTADGYAEEIGTERLTPGELSYDDQSDPFIHRMVSRETGEGAVTLHAYGCGTAKEVMETFHSTRAQCAYQEVQDKNCDTNISP